MSTFWAILSTSARSLARKPSTSLLIVFVLALGIGLNATLFSFLDALYLAPPAGIRHPQELVLVSHQVQEAPRSLPLSYPLYEDLAARSSRLRAVAAYRPVTVAYMTPDGTDLVAAEVVSETYFDLLGVSPLLGRVFVGREVDPDSSVVINESFWRDQLGGDPAILGSKLWLNNRPFLVRGIAGGRFKGLKAASSTRIWFHVSALPQVCECPLEQLEDRDSQTFRVVGRLKPGESAESLRAELSTFPARLEESPVDRKSKLWAESLVGQSGAKPTAFKVGFLLLGILFLLLALICTNISSLLFVRALGRRREFAISLALGGSRSRLCQQAFLECLLLCLAGALLGLLPAFWSQELFQKLAPPLLSSASIETSINLRLAGFILLLVLAAGGTMAVAPVWLTSRTELMGALRGPSPARRQGFGRGSTLHLLAILQIAVCTVALSAAGLLLGGLRAAWKTDLGFRPESLLTASFDLRSLGLSETQGRVFQEELIRRTVELRGVTSAALAERPPLGGFREWLEATPVPGGPKSLIGVMSVGPRYFETVGIDLLRGRGFTASEGESVLVINELLARKSWPGQNPIGRLLYLEDQAGGSRVVGVVGNARFLTVDEDARPFIYRPLSQVYRSEASLIVQTEGPPGTFIEAVRVLVGQMERRLPLTQLATASEVVNRSLWPARATASLLTLVGLLALLLAAGGIYGVTAQVILARYREIGIRLALGVRRSRLMASLLLDGTSIAVIGCLLGTAATMAGRNLLAVAAQGLELPSFSICFFIGAILLGVGLSASFIPATRILKLHPSTVLTQRA